MNPSEVSWRVLSPEKDLPDLIGLLSQSVDFKKYCASSREKDFALYFALNLLVHSTGSIALDHQGKLVGVLLYDRKGEKTPFEDLFEAAQKAYDKAFPEGRKDLYGEAVKAMLEANRKSYDGEIVLLSLSPLLQGLGLGRKLFETFLEESQKMGLHLFYLTSDTDCNYAFYPKVGFRKIQERKISFPKGEKKEEMNVFLFEREI